MNRRIAKTILILARVALASLLWVVPALWAQIPFGHAGHDPVAGHAIGSYAAPSPTPW